MKHEELERKVAEIISEKPWKHDCDHDCQTNTKKCLKCGTIYWRWGKYTVGCSESCTIPDPYTIPLVRKGNEQAYDACMGRAIECFRESWMNSDDADPALVNEVFDKVASEYCCEFADANEQHDMYRYWMLGVATPAEIWTICVNAKGNGNE